MYYLSILGKEMGPFTLEELQELAKQGRLSEDTAVKVDGKTMKAGEIEGWEAFSLRADSSIIKLWLKLAFNRILLAILCYWISIVFYAESQVDALLLCDFESLEKNWTPENTKLCLIVSLCVIVCGLISSGLSLSALRMLGKEGKPSKECNFRLQLYLIRLLWLITIVASIAGICFGAGIFHFTCKYFSIIT